MLLTSFDEKAWKKAVYEDGFDDGTIYGKELGKEEGIEQGKEAQRILDIRMLINLGSMTDEELARNFDVSLDYIQSIKSGDV